MAGTGSDGLVDVEEVGERVPTVGIDLERQILGDGVGAVLLCGHEGEVQAAGRGG
jgi:hypothetical protein